MMNCTDYFSNLEPVLHPQGSPVVWFGYRGVARKLFGLKEIVPVVTVVTGLQGHVFDKLYPKGEFYRM